MLYELATLACPILSVPAAAAGARAWVGAPDAEGRVLGCWRTEIGALGRVLVLRGFEDTTELAAERSRALHGADPFNAGAVVSAVETDGYAPFAFLPTVRPGTFGRIYEFRTYRLKPGGLAPTLAGWERAIGPAHEYTRHLVAGLYALDGAPRITHVWAFASFEQRMALRAQAYGAGVWPPRGGPDSILEATSTIALPEEWSPLR